MKKVCKICGKLKLLSDFHKAKQRKDGHISDCKECCSERQYERNEVLRKIKKNTKPKYGKEYFENKKEELLKYMKNKCIKCEDEFKNSWEHYNIYGNLCRCCGKKGRF